MAWLHDLYKKNMFGVVYTRTEAMCADIFTNCFRGLPKWLQAIRLIGIRPPDAKPEMPPAPGPRPETIEKKAKANRTIASDSDASVAIYVPALPLMKAS